LIRHLIYEGYGQRGVVANCVRHFLRALAWCGCLGRLSPNRYRFIAWLPVVFNGLAALLNHLNG